MLVFYFEVVVIEARSTPFDAAWVNPPVTVIVLVVHDPWLPIVTCLIERTDSKRPAICVRAVKV